MPTLLLQVLLPWTFCSLQHYFPFPPDPSSLFHNFTPWPLHVHPLRVSINLIAHFPTCQLINFSSVTLCHQFVCAQTPSAKCSYPIACKQSQMCMLHANAPDACRCPHIHVAPTNHQCHLTGSNGMRKTSAHKASVWTQTARTTTDFVQPSDGFFDQGMQV